MTARFTPEYKRQAVTAYDAARQAGKSASEAAAIAGHNCGVIHIWRTTLPYDTEADTEQRHVAKRRACLRCGRGFRSAWAGERICPKCKTGHISDGLPDSWGATATVGVGD